MTKYRELDEKVIEGEETMAEIMLSEETRLWRDKNELREACEGMKIDQRILSVTYCLMLIAFGALFVLWMQGSALLAKIGSVNIWLFIIGMATLGNSYYHDLRLKKEKIRLLKRLIKQAQKDALKPSVLALPAPAEKLELDQSAQDGKEPVLVSAKKEDDCPS